MAPGIRIPRKWFISIGLSSALLLSGLLGLTPANAACKTTPEGRVLVMSNNVFEAEKRDSRKHGDMRNLVDQMKKMAPKRYAPDIMLVQEARRSAVKHIKKFMRRTFGCRFSIPVTASKGAWQWLNKYSRLLGRDTGIILNKTTMETRGKGFVRHGYKKKLAAAKGQSVKVKESTWVKVIEKNNPNQNRRRLTVVASSSHFPRGSDFKNQRTNRRLKKRFSLELARKLEGVEADGSDHNNVIHVIGGDFNMSRYKGWLGNPMPPFRALTRRPWTYIDGPTKLAPSGRPNPIDFLFSTGKPLRARMHKSNNHHVRSRRFYSNHDLRWSLLAPYSR